MAEIENVTTIESVDVSCHHSRDTWIEVGYVLPVDDPSIPPKLEKYTRVFADSVLMKAECFGLELDEVKFSYELGACTKDVDLGWYQMPKGSLGGNCIKYQCMVDGVPRVETHREWQMTPHTDPSWDVKGCYITKIKGDPCVYNKHAARLCRTTANARTGHSRVLQPQYFQALARHSTLRQQTDAVAAEDQLLDQVKAVDLVRDAGSEPGQGR